MKKNCDVLILGGGVIGLACARYLLRAGRGVTVLDRNTVGRGASHGNCGTITPSLLPLPAPGTVARALQWLFKPDAPLRIKPAFDPALLRWLLAFASHCNERDYRRVALVKGELLKASRVWLAELIHEERLDCEFVESGHLTVYRDPRAFERGQGEVPLWRELGLEVETLDGAQARAKEPALNDSVVGAHFHPGDARLRPDRYVAELARVVRTASGEIHEGVDVRGFQQENGRVTAVATSRGDYAAKEIVFALGAWSPLLARKLDLRLPIQPGKGYSITYAAAAGAPRLPLVLKERSVCVTSWTSGVRLGSTMEFAGYDDSLNRVRLSALTRAATEYLRVPAAGRAEEEWCGWRPMTPDDLPILGRAPQLTNLTLACGHGMLGVSLSAATGRLIAEQLTGKSGSLDWTPYGLERFAR
ncbi:MAG: FAD-dependent oxidoreductase [Sinobacteraceae bacterium]|nr:FAD-dependent oxidoreductase [Nevskiaceae bacterium]